MSYLKKQEDFFQKRARTRMFKFMQEEYEGQEKCSAYFFAQMKMREERGLIKELEKDGKMITGSENLRKVVEKYYTRLFEKEELDKNAQGIFLRGLGERLPEEETKSMDRCINKN